MTPPAVLDPIDQIRQADADVEEQQERLEKFAGWLADERTDTEEVATDVEAAVATFKETVRSWATTFHERIPEALPPDAQNEIRSLLLGGLGLLEKADVEERVLDHIDKMLVSLEAVRHVLRDAVDEDFGDGVSTMGDAVRQIEEWLPAVDRELMAQILGMSTRTVQRRLKDDNKATTRARLVLTVMAILRRSWTPDGVLAWFFRRRSDLDGRPPIEVLSNPHEYDTILTLARQGRASHGD